MQTAIIIYGFTMRLNVLLACIVVCLSCSPGSVAQKKPVANITEKDIKRVINEHSDCSSLDQIAIDHLEYFELFGDASKQAIVVASTCMTGTAGPDVHAVFARNASGNIVEHSLDRAAFVFGPDTPKLPVFGNPNYGIAVKNGRLVGRWVDASGRKNPLIIWYKWDGKKFIVDHMKAEGPFTTSYDCGKATQELDRAICYSPAVAPLDIKLTHAYREALQQSAHKDALREQQRQWLAGRGKECVIYKWWVDCLTDMYTKRIAELRQAPGGETGQ